MNIYVFFITNFGKIFTKIDIKKQAFGHELHRHNFDL